MSDEKVAFLVTPRERKLIERIRQVKFARDVTITIVDGQPTRIGKYKEEEEL